MKRSPSASKPRVRLGQRYRDSVSGWEGVATARYEYWNGCIRYELAGQDQDGKPESFAFDEQQLVEAESNKEVQPSARAGGPRESKPVRRPGVPSRW